MRKCEFKDANYIPTKKQKIMNINCHDQKISYSKCCNSNVSNCEYTKVISITMKHYDFNNSHDEYHDTLYYDKIIEILNAFDHVLFCHNTTADFISIYTLLGGECKLSKCIVVESHYNVDTQSSKTSFLKKILNKLHCYFRHSYDMGFRLNISTESKQLISTDKISDKLKQLQKILKSNKTKNYRRIHERENRFSSNLNQIKTTQKKTSIPVYSYSYDFNYWEHCKHSNNYDDRKLYVPPKYRSL
eukprot:472503_1